MIKLDLKLIKAENPISPQTALKLKMELFNKSSKLEGLMVSDIINMLQHANNSELDGIFNAFIVHRLSHLGPNTLTQQSRDEISIYLDSIKFKYNTQNKLIVNDGINIFSYGGWLEASALVNSTSLNNAGKYVATYLQDKNTKEQESYVVGLSNSEYMKQAFKTEPVLIEFKKMRKSIYFNTVGVPTK